MADPVISASGREYSGGVSDLTPALNPWASILAPDSPSDMLAPFQRGVPNPNFGFLSPHFDAQVQGQMLANKVYGPISPLIMGQSYDPNVDGEERYTVGGRDVDPDAGSEYLGEEAAYRLNNWRASDPGGGALRNIQRGGFIDPFRPMTENEYDAAVHYIGSQHRIPLVQLATKAYTEKEALFGGDTSKEKIRDDYADYISSRIGRRKSLNEAIQAGISLPDYLDVATDATPEQQLQEYSGRSISNLEGREYPFRSFSSVPPYISPNPTSQLPPGTPQISQPVNLGQTHADTLQSFFDIPEEPTESLFDAPSVSNANTLMMNSLIPISTGGGMGGMIEDGVQTDFEPVDVMPWGEGEQYMDAQGFETVMPDLSNLPVEDQTVFDSTTPGQIGDYLRAQEQEFMLPSGPEEMYIPFEQDQETIDREAREEQIRLDKIMTKAREDRIAQEKIAENARQAKEADERRARELREEAEEAEDRQDKERLSREAEERDRQAKERAQEERNAVEAARLDALAEATEKINMAQKKKEEEAGRQQLKALEEFMARQAADRAFRKKQQASMPKSWAFF